MSLLHTVQWYRRHHDRHLDLELWPESASVSASDLAIAGESMTEMARRVGTPCIRVSEAAAHSWSSARGERFCGIVVTRVEAVAPAADGHGHDVWVDAELDGCEPLEQTVRMIGRASTAPRRPCTIRPSRRYGDLRCLLPGDLAEGDLLAFVVVRPVPLHDIRRRTHHRERLL